MNTTLAPKTEKRLTLLHGTCEKLILACALGLFLFPVLFILCPLGLLYKKWCRTLFEDPEIRPIADELRRKEKKALKEESKSTTTSGKIAYLLLYQKRFVFPSYLIVIVIIGIVIMGISLSIAEKA